MVGPSLGLRDADGPVTQVIYILQRPQFLISGEMKFVEKAEVSATKCKNSLRNRDHNSDHPFNTGKQQRGRGRNNQQSSRDNRSFIAHSSSTGAKKEEVKRAMFQTSHGKSIFISRSWKLRYNLAALVIGLIPRQGLITSCASFPPRRIVVTIKYISLALPHVSHLIGYNTQYPS